MSLPERLGRLRRVRRIGVGGFASVWLYRDDELDSDVAVKGLADNWAARDDIRERFLEEARILRRADSDHLVRVYDIGEVDHTPYFVMSYANRGSVANLIEREPTLPLEQVVDVVCQAAQGLSVLHRIGVIHRDIKPQNLLLSALPGDAQDDDPGHESVRVLVADLGVAKAMMFASGLTQVVGTPAYMAPEQASGVGIDRRADIHALGAVAYRLLTGQLVRSGGFTVLTQPEQPPPPSQWMHEQPLSPAVDEVLMTALAVDPEHRWHDVETFARALQDAAQVSSGNTLSLPPPPAGQDGPWATRERAFATPNLSSPPSSPAPTPTPAATETAVGTASSGRLGYLALLAVLIVVGFLVGYLLVSQLT